MNKIGLYFYNARFYDATLGCFAQADTIIPGAGNVLALDRYAYTLNNPLRYTYPSGHGGPWDWLVALGRSGAVGKALVVNAGDVVHHINRQTQKIFHPDANTDPVDRFWACTEIGGGSVLFAAIAVEVTAGTLTTAATSGGVEVAATGSGAATAACADGDCTNETNALVRMGEEALGSLEAQPIIQKIANSATQNPSSRVVSMGSNGLYQKEGYTFFELPGKAWNTLWSAGTKFVEAANNQFTYNQMNQGKEFGFTINPEIGMGYFTKIEYAILSGSEKYLEIIRDGWDYYFVPK